ISSAKRSRSASASTAFRAIAASCARSIVTSAGSTIDSRSCSASNARCFRRRVSFLASSRTRFVATANNQARSFCIEVCLSARTKVSCATSSAQSRSPKRRVRYLTNAALYVRKSRSTSVTRLPAISQQREITIRQSIFSRRAQLDRHATARNYHPLADRERLTQIWLQLEQSEVCFRVRFYTEHCARVLVPHISPHTVTQNERHVAGTPYVCAFSHTRSGIRCGHVRHRALLRRYLCRFELHCRRSRRSCTTDSRARHHDRLQ